ncbi:MAG: hypothetical protein IJA61_03740 [Clostridia bacterium]|nr:hypothetical protein [Clostridia bacterium]
MDKFKVNENDSGFCIDYIYTQNNDTKCLRLSEDNDYFSFSIFSPNTHLINLETININTNNPLFSPFKKLLEDNQYIKIMEEGTSEGKSLTLQSRENAIDMIFSLTNTPTNLTTISITNVRLASPNVTFAKGSPEISDFKNKLHSALSEIKDCVKENTM